jgi:hypothetical protein
MKSGCLTVLALIFTSVVAAAAGTPQVTLEVLETDPASPAALHGTDQVYVHFRYSSDMPISIWVTPYFHGKRAAAMTSGSPPYPAGDGEGFGWFAFHDAGQVDSIHLQVAPEGSGYPNEGEPTPVDFTWDGTPGAWHTPAAWVEPFRQKEAAREKQAYQAYMNQPLGASGHLALAVFGVLLLGAVIVLFVWPIRSLILWRGKWRVLAALPLVAVGLKTLKVAADVSADRTSHNLLPFEYLILAAFIAPYMIVVWLLHRAALRRES